MLVSCFNLSQSFNYAPYLFFQKTVQNRDQLFLYTDPGGREQDDKDPPIISMWHCECYRNEA